MTGGSGDLFRDLLQSVSAQMGPAPRITGTAGGGAVTVEMEGTERVLSVTIAPEAAGDPAMLGELVAAAMNDALAKGRASSLDSAERFLANLPPDLPGRADRG